MEFTSKYNYGQECYLLQLTMSGWTYTKIVITSVIIVNDSNGITESYITNAYPNVLFNTDVVVSTQEEAEEIVNQRNKK